jgi:hypothetical protein
MLSSRGRRRSFSAVCFRGILLPGLSLLVGCGTGSDKTPTTIRLARLYKPAPASAAPHGAQAFPRTEWRFDRSSSRKIDVRFEKTGGIEAGPGMAAVSIRDGRLMGRATSATPLLRVERFSGLDSGDLLHAVEIKLRVSAGTELSVDFDRDE